MPQVFDTVINGEELPLINAITFFRIRKLALEERLVVANGCDAALLGLNQLRSKMHSLLMREADFSCS